MMMRTATRFALLLVTLQVLLAEYEFDVNPKMDSISMPKDAMKMAQKASEADSKFAGERYDRAQVTKHLARVAGIDEPVSYFEAGASMTGGHKLAVLLHGAAFSAETWRFVGTVHALAVEASVRVVVPDLENYQGAYARSDVQQRLLQDFLRAIGWQPRPKSLMIVAASQGGAVATPYVLDPRNAAFLAGYVSVSGRIAAPATVEETAASAAHVPTLLIWGGQDHPNSPKAKKHKRLFPSHQMVVLPDAPHAAYLSEPLLFNELIVRFALRTTGYTVQRSIATGDALALNVVAAWALDKDETR